MRNPVFLARLAFICFIAFLFATGCGKGEDLTAEEQSLRDGMVKNPDTGFYEFPNADGSTASGDGYDEPSDSADDSAESDDDSDEDYDDEEMDDEEDADEDDDSSDESAVASSGDDYGGYGGGYGGYGGVQQGDPKYYAEKIAPILRAHCYNCHGGGPRGEKGSVALHSPNAIDEADVVSANDLNGSLLYELVTADRNSTDPMMPPKGPGLSKSEIETIAKWINDGASFGDAPMDAEPFVVAGGSNDGYGGDYGGYGGVGGGDSDNPDAPAAPVRPQNLAEWASLSFQNGRDKEAMNQLFAQALVRSSEGEAVLDKYRWVPALKQPKLAIRWGLGVKYLAKFKYEGPPRPAGIVQNLPGDDYDDVEKSENILGDLKNDTIDYYAGDIGSEVILRLKKRIERAYYGDILKDELEKLSSDNSDEDEWDDDDSGYGGGSSGYGGYGGGGGRDKDSEKPDADKIEQVLPGVTLLGVAGNSELFARAKDEGVDVLVVFDVVADPNGKRKIVDTSTRVRLYDVATEQQIAVTGKMNNIEIQKLRSEDPGDETIINEVDKLFSKTFDKSYRANPFPDVTTPKGQKAVLGFVRKLLAQTSENPLPKLSEVRFYEHRGGIKPEHVDLALKKILPGTGEKLKDAESEDEIRSLLGTWLIVKESLADSDDDDDEDDEDDGDDDFR